MADTKLFQDNKTGKLVEFISKHDKEFAMVRDAAGNVTYLTLDQLVPYDSKKGRLAKIEAPELIVPEEQAPDTHCSSRRRPLESQYCTCRTNLQTPSRSWLCNS